MKNVIDKIDALKANTENEKEFKTVWGISLDEHINKMMMYVQKSDARIKEKRESIKK
ncbi:MAG: hypothetical protein J6O51_03810 [Bacteroidales bacterium]|nr:hypothetical protein [Bacteroidales bacterium]